MGVPQVMNGLYMFIYGIILWTWMISGYPRFKKPPNKSKWFGAEDCSGILQPGSSLTLGGWLMMVDDGWWWLMMVDDGWWWLMMVDDGWWWLMMVDDGWWWLMMVDDGWWWLMMVDDGWWWLMMVDDGWWLVNPGNTKWMDMSVFFWSLGVSLQLWPFTSYKY